MARRYHSTATLSDVKEFLRKTRDKTRRAFHRSQETIACTCCYDDHPLRDLVMLHCHHSYCKPCFRQLVISALKDEDHWPPRCCGATPVDDATCLENIPRALALAYKQKREEYSVPIRERYYCPVPDCGLFIPAEAIEEPFGRARCRAGHATCMRCGRPAHKDAVECPRNADLDDLVRGIARRQGWRRCHRCLTMIEHTTACRRIRCRCGAEFCYVCGAVWWTCGCTERQLKEIKERARRNEEARRWVEERRVIRKAEDAARRTEDEARRREDAALRIEGVGPWTDTVAPWADDARRGT